LKRAKEIFEKVKGSLLPERRETIGHIFSTIENYPQILGTLGEQAFIAKYNEISGKRVRSIKGLDADLDPGVAFTVKEIVNNYPVDPEIERAKRGYTSKQIMRISPYLKKSFKDQNPNGFPPPFPTFGDLETWSQRQARTGEVPPSWASPRAQISIPKEIFDALPKSQDGYAKLPPRNFPVHLMPVWNYVASKEISTSALYSGSDPGVVVVRAIKKYVEKRGGGLVDVPTRKLDEVHLTHADIFKAEMTDDQAWKWAAENYIDPVRLLAIVKNLKPETKKSISLVVGTSDTYTPYESIRKSMDVIKIQKLKEILIARKNK